MVINAQDLTHLIFPRAGPEKKTLRHNTYNFHTSLQATFAKAFPLVKNDNLPTLILDFAEVCYHVSNW